MIFLFFVSYKERALKAECKRIEAYMKKQATQQLQEAHDDSELRLKEVLHDARIEFEVEKMIAVRQSREDEIGHAIENAAKVADLEDKKRKKIILEAEKEKAVCYSVNICILNLCFFLLIQLPGLQREIVGRLSKYIVGSLVPQSVRKY